MHFRAGNIPTILAAFAVAVMPVPAMSFDVNSPFSDDEPSYEIICNEGGADENVNFYVTYNYDFHDSAFLTFTQAEFDTIFSPFLSYTGEKIPAAFMEDFDEALVETPYGDFRMAVYNYNNDEINIDHIVVIMRESDFRALFLQTENHGISMNGYVCERLTEHPGR